MKGSDKPTVTSMVVSNRRRLIYAFPDGRQMLEEYDLKTHQILTRRIKKPATFKQTKWEIEIGEPQDKSSPQVLLKSNNTPIFIRKDTLDCFQWRIRNLAYPQEAYLLEVDSDKQEVVIRTTVKKYYKRFDIPDLKRLNTKLEKAPLSFTHKNNTLIVSYRKPEMVLEKEIAMRREFEKMNAKKPKENDIQCTTQ